MAGLLLGRKHLAWQILSTRTFAVLASIFGAVAVARAQESDLSPTELVQRGMRQFRERNLEDSITSFDRSAEIDPMIEPHLWQRGISYYYTKQFKEGQRQFELHQTVNPHDVENAAWHFICVARLNGLEVARKKILPIDVRRDKRIPMGEIYELYAGRATEATVLEAARKSDDQRAIMYAHLYLGLYREVAKNAEEARRHMRLAAAAKLKKHYMHEVAKVHVALRGWQAESTAQATVE